MKIKITIDEIPAEIKAFETPQGWRCEVTWMLQWQRGCSVLGRGHDAGSAVDDWHSRAKDDGHSIASR